MAQHTSPRTPQGPTRTSTSMPVRAAWGVLGAFLLVWSVFEAVKHGGWVIPLAVLGLIAPDLTFFIAKSEWTQPGRLPKRAVPAYNLMHRPITPVVWMVLSTVVTGGKPEANAAPFTLGLMWLTHIALDRAMGYGLRSREGWQRTAA